jgi:poly-gamma-glutamate synthesis protein (capsule biosynthesis protein)
VKLREAAGPVRLSVAAVGDVGVVGRVRRRAHQHGFDSLFASAAPALGAADVGFANLEFPIAGRESVRPGRSAEFHHDDEVVDALARAGVRVVSIANNHIMDCGVSGLERTLDRCARAGIAAVGAGRTVDEACAPARIECRGRRVAFLAYASARQDAARADHPGVAPLEADRLRRDLASARSGADELIVSVHWGSMYVDYPPPRVLEIASLLEALGADLVLGHHPHVLQGWRIAPKPRAGPATLTLFSLGDIVLDPAAGDFEASIARETRRDTGVFTIDLADEPGLSFVPLHLDGEGVPLPADPARAAAARARLDAISAGLDHAGDRFHRESAPALMRYELESLGSHLRAGRFGRALRLLGAVRPRHLPMIWSALVGGGRRG